MKTLKILAVFAIVALSGALLAAGPDDLIQGGVHDPTMYKAVRDIARAENSRILSGHPTLASSTTHVTWTVTAATPTYMIDGVYKGALGASQTVLTGRTIPTGYGCRYLVLVNGSGVFSVVQGKTFLTDPGISANPVQPASKAVLGTVKVVATLAPFIPGTTTLTSASATVTLTNDLIRPISFENLQNE